MPVEITGAWVRAEKGIGGRIVLGVVAPGLKPRPPEERRRTEPPGLTLLRVSLSELGLYCLPRSLDSAARRA
jgi:hypothetical protein